MNSVQKFIDRTVNQSYPRLVSRQEAQSIITDHDHTPYTRYYRSRLGEVIVTGNEAGWRVKHNSCYEPKKIPVITKSNLCFQPPCNTVFPCYNSEPSCQAREYNNQCLINRR